LTSHGEGGQPPGCDVFDDPARAISEHDASLKGNYLIASELCTREPGQCSKGIEYGMVRS
jgi:hypothetical protein